MTNKNPKKENLKANTERTPKERKELAQKAGIASGEVRRAKKTMREMLNYLLEKEITNRSGEKATTQEAITVSLINQALKGNVKAWEVIRDTIGEKPKQDINLSTGGLVVQVADEETKKIIEDV